MGCQAPRRACRDGGQYGIMGRFVPAKSHHNAAMQQHLIDLLQRYRPADIAERGHRLHALDFIARTPDCTSRHTPYGHVTASAWILSPDRHAVLLTHHRKLGRWLQLGGHVEQDGSVQAAALREAREESGIDDLRLLDEALFDLDVHLIPARKDEPDHFHFDFRFLLQAIGTDFRVGEESLDLAWVELDRLASGENDESIRRMAGKTASLIVV